MDNQPVILDRNAILGQAEGASLPFELVDVPEWGGKVKIRTLSAGERDEFESKIFDESRDKKKKVNVRARLVAIAAVDANGKRMFGDLDAQLLANKDGRVMDRISAAVSKLNGLGKQDIEDLEKNSETDPTAGSS